MKYFNKTFLIFIIIFVIFFGVLANVALAANPVGSHDGVTNATCKTSGWAYDPDTPSTSITVHVYRDAPAGAYGATLVGAYPTNVLRTDVNNALGITGNHGFNITLPAALKDGNTHSLYIYAINTGSGSNQLLNNSPKSITCPNPNAPTLTFTANPSSIDSGQTSTLTWSATNATSCTASSDPVGGFSGTKATSGTYVTRVLMDDNYYHLTCTGTGGNITKSITITVTTVENLDPIGFHDTVNNTTCKTTGWAYDPNAPSTSINVHVMSGGVSRGVYTTNVLRTDVNNDLGITGNHGFNIALPEVLKDGRPHSLYIYGLNTSPDGNDPLLTNSPKTITCPNTATTLDFVGSPTQVPSGQPATLTWSTTNMPTGATCTASGDWSGTKASSGTTSTGPITSNKTYTLTCNGVTKSVLISLASPGSQFYCDNSMGDECKRFFDYSTSLITCHSRKDLEYRLERKCNQDDCYWQPIVDYICGQTKWKIMSANLITTNLAEGDDDVDDCHMKIRLVKSMDWQNPDVGSSGDEIRCADDAPGDNNTPNSTSIIIPAAFQANDQASGAGYFKIRFKHLIPPFGDQVSWAGKVEMTAQRPFLEYFSLTAINTNGVSQTINARTDNVEQTITVYKGANLQLKWKALYSTSNLLYIGTTVEYPNGYGWTSPGNSGSRNLTASFSTNFDFILTGFAGESYAEYWKTGGLKVIVLDPPTFSVDLTAIPDSGTTPLNNVDLKANVSGTATGNIVYKFDCTNNGTWEHTSAATTTDPYTIANLCDYNTVGTYTAKVQATRGSSTATDTVAIDVSATLSASLMATPASGTAPLNGAVLTADPSGTATGTINYTFYCNRADAGKDITAGYIHKLDATNIDPYSVPAGVCNSVYSTPGIYTAKVIVERGSLATESRVTVTVLAPTNNPPTVVPSSEVFIYCADSRHPILHFTYFDLDGDTQGGYTIQVDNNSNFSSPEDNTGWHYTTSTQYTTSGAFNWDTTYYWRVKAMDSHNLESNWSTTDSFRIPLHAYPVPDFTFLPQNPSKEEEVRFTDNSSCFDDTPTTTECSSSYSDSFSWDFDVNDDGLEGVEPLISTSEDVIASYSNQGLWNVKLEVRDKNNYTCSITKQVRISYSLPKWKEVKPD